MSFIHHSVVAATLQSRKLFSVSRQQDVSELDVSGADAVVVQAEGEAAPRVRLRLGSVSAATARRVPRRRQDAQSAAGGAGRWQVVGEGVGGGRGGGGGGGRGGRGQGGRHGAEHAVVGHIGDGRLARLHGRPGLPAVGHRVRLGQSGPAVVALLPARRPGGVVAAVEGGRTLENGALGRWRGDSLHLITVQNNRINKILSHLI